MKIDMVWLVIYGDAIGIEEREREKVLVGCIGLGF